MSAAIEVWFCCDCCSMPTTESHSPELVLCSSCATEAMLSDAADAVDAHGDRLDIELWALADSVLGLPDAGAL